MRRLLGWVVAAELAAGSVGVVTTTLSDGGGARRAARSDRDALVAARPSPDSPRALPSRSSQAKHTRSAAKRRRAPIDARSRPDTFDVDRPGRDAQSETPSFAAPRDFATGAAPSSVAFNTASGDQFVPFGVTNLLVSNSVAVGDFNEDGRDDVVETNVIANSMSVFVGDGHGGFAAPVIVPAGGLPSFVVAGRLDLDEHLDLAVADLGSNDIAIFHGDGHGGFGLADRVPIPGPRHIAIGDLEGDGVPDLAVASAGPACPPPQAPCAGVGWARGAVVVLGGVRGPSGTVTFGGRVRQILTDTSSLDGESVSPGVVALVDLNGDGQDDLVAASGYRSNAGDELPGGGVTGDDVFVRLHRPRTATGPGASDTDPYDTDASQPGLRVGGAPIGIAVGDFDRDSHPDLAVLGNRSGDVTTLLGSATGRLTEKERNATVGMIPRSLVAADLDGDGLLDLVTAGFGAGTVCVFVGRGDGTFAASVDHWVGDAPTSVAVGQFDGDHRPDVVAGRIRGDALTLLQNRGAGPGDGVVITRDQPYLPAAGDRFAAHHTIDVYQPPRGSQSFSGPGKPYPVIVFFHGGGSVTNKTHYALVMRRLASVGFLVASAEYRLDNAADDQQGSREEAAALRWTIGHAPGYGADPAALTIVGHSYGGGVAMKTLAAAENVDILRRVKGFVATSGFGADMAQNAHTILQRQQAGGPALPALLLINGTDGFEQGLVGVSVAANAALQAAGADSRQCVFAGRDHVTTTAHIALADDPARRALEQFFRAQPVDCANPTRDVARSTQPS